MSISDKVKNIIGQPEGQTIEYKAVLPPSKNMARLMAGFANTEGGYIILGVSDAVSNYSVIGLSEDFHAIGITTKALELLNPKPGIIYEYVNIEGKNIFAVEISKSEKTILLEGKQYVRKGHQVAPLHPQQISFKQSGYEGISKINIFIEKEIEDSTSSKASLFEHYQSILKILDDLGETLYPQSPLKPPMDNKGKILMRILFSSFVDTFESYLSELLYEIYLAKPATLKSKQQVSIEEVLNCSDIQEFIKYWANQKIGKLQKGSVKGFINDNQQIRDLEVLDKPMQKEIEKILQIRHLYTHRNGVVDEKFLQFFPGAYTLNTEHQMAVSEFCGKMLYLLNCVKLVDDAALLKYNLSTIN